MLRAGLRPALEWLVRWMAEKHRLSVVVTACETGEGESPDAMLFLFQVIRELLFNVAKYAGVHTASVAISSTDGELRVQVSDEGVGFDPASLRVAGGTAGGFGLFSIRERLDLLGGRLEIESGPGKGSRFTVWLPLPRVARLVDPAAPVPPAGSGARKIRVLVVEDHLVVRQGLVRLLAEAPDLAVVGEAADGETAVALTRELSPNVVTMDVNLPGMSGIEATRGILACCPAARVIGLSMYGEVAQAAAMRKAGAVRYLTKGAPAETLLAAIRACLQSGT